MKATIQQYIELFHYNGITDFFLSKHKATENERTPAPLEIEKVNALQQLKEKYANCTFCDIEKTRMKFVYGEGSIYAKYMVIGNPPIASENVNGRPFVGDLYGDTFNKMMAAINLKREDLYITNITKCKTNKLEISELQKCLPYLYEQIELIKPKKILVMGLLGAKVLLNQNENMEYFRNNQPHYFRGIPVYVTYNPLDFQTDVNLKKPAWDDIRKFMPQ